jgi:hypothetical protein
MTSDRDGIERMNCSKETDEVISFAQIYILPIYAGITAHDAEHERTRISDQIVETSPGSPCTVMS